MVSQILTLSALVALSQAKAIVSNQCEHSVYVWSVPEAQGMANGLSIPPGARYDEPWRAGTSANPGISIKVSPYSDGISQGKSEIDYQYVVDSDKVWINLSNVRGDAFGGNTTFYTCHGPSKGPNVPTGQCSITDDLELVLCGTDRTGEGKDISSRKEIRQCARSLVARDGKKPPRPPRQCNARVIGPKRPPQQKTEAASDKSKKETKTVQLKTVLREYPWVQNSTHVNHVGGCAPPLVKIMTNHPDVDENVQHLARNLKGEYTIYIASMCKQFLPRTKCYEIEHFLASENPDFIFTDGTTDEEDNTPVIANSTRPYPTIWLRAMCQAFMPMVECALVAEHLEDRHLDFDFEAYHFKGLPPHNQSTIRKPTGKKSAKIEARKDKKDTIYISSMCHTFSPGVKCSKIEHFLEKQNPLYDFTDDTTDEEENTPVIADNTHLQRTILFGDMCQKYFDRLNCTMIIEFMKKSHQGFEFGDKDIFSRNKATTRNPTGKKSTKIEARKDKKPIVCVNNLCHQQRHFASCHKIKKEMEKANHEVDYTTDEDKGCHTDKE